MEDATAGLDMQFLRCASRERRECSSVTMDYAKSGPHLNVQMGALETEYSVHISRSKTKKADIWWKMFD